MHATSTERTDGCDENRLTVTKKIKGAEDNNSTAAADVEGAEGKCQNAKASVTKWLLLFLKELDSSWHP